MARIVFRIPFTQSGLVFGRVNDARLRLLPPAEKLFRLFHSLLLQQLDVGAALRRDEAAERVQKLGKLKVKVGTLGLQLVQGLHRAVELGQRARHHGRRVDI